MTDRSFFRRCPSPGVKPPPRTVKKLLDLRVILLHALCHSVLNSVGVLLRLSSFLLHALSSAGAPSVLRFCYSAFHICLPSRPSRADRRAEGSFGEYRTRFSPYSLLPNSYTLSRRLTSSPALSPLITVSSKAIFLGGRFLGRVP